MVILKSKYSIVIAEMAKGKTLARALLSAALNQLLHEDVELSQPASILEIGGESASHQRYLPQTWHLTLSNYKNLPGVDLIVDAENKFSLADNSFDGALCFNALYVIDDYFNCFSEALRVSNDFIIFNVPLIQALVPEPHDYTRLTEDRLKSLIADLKINHKIFETKIIPVGGTFSAAISLIDPYLKFWLLRLPAYLLAALLDGLDKKINRRCPIMYLVMIKKSHE